MSGSAAWSAAASADPVVTSVRGRTSTTFRAAVSFTSAPERLAVRPARRERLTVLHEKWIARMAGPLAGDSGTVIVVDVPDRAALDELLTEAPHFSTKGVR
ncbi:YciI family protein [Streptomyces sp. NPDC056817]|uniref:YciI family protein n=1 Tax=Streptomyces sp. NPDC056817 TaxID=3345950 RepID=UPI003676673D